MDTGCTRERTSRTTAESFSPVKRLLMNSAMINALRSGFSSLPIGRRLLLGVGVSLGVAIAGTLAGMLTGFYLDHQAQTLLIDAMQEVYLSQKLVLNLKEGQIHFERIQERLKTHPQQTRQEAIFCRQDLQEFQTTWNTLQTSYQSPLVQENEQEMQLYWALVRRYHQHVLPYVTKINRLLDRLETVPLTTVQRAQMQQQVENLLADSETQQALYQWIEQVGQFVRLIEETEQEQALAALQRANWVSIELALVAMTVSGLVGFWGARHLIYTVVCPLRVMADTIEQIQQERDFTKRVPLSIYEDEVTTVGRALNRLLGRTRRLIQKNKVACAQLQRFNCDLERQVQQRTAELNQALAAESILRRVTDRLRSSLDRDEILQTVVQALTQKLSLGACSIGFCNPERSQFTIAYDCSVSLPSMQGEVFDLIQFTDNFFATFHERPWVYRCLNHSRRGRVVVLSCPIPDPEEKLGILSLLRHPHETFSDLEIRLACQVANQCAIALRQARLYQKAQAQVTELQRLNQLKDDFLSTVSHELRTPLSSIRMATEMLEIGLIRAGYSLDDHTPLARYFHILKTEEQRELDLVNDLLDLARLDARADPLNLTTLSLDVWIAHLVEPFETRAHRQQQHFWLDLDANLPPLTTDFAYLTRILSELLNNACKYTPPGEEIGVTVRGFNGACPAKVDLIKPIHPQVATVLQGEEGESEHSTANHLQSVPYFQIRVSNSGVWISPEEQDRIFDRFYRIPSKDPWKHGGTGLGLALVKGLVTRLGGTIQVLSLAAEHGSDRAKTTFIIQLPGGWPN